MEPNPRISKVNFGWHKLCLSVGLLSYIKLLRFIIIVIIILIIMYNNYILLFVSIIVSAIHPEIVYSERERHLQQRIVFQACSTIP